MGWRRERAKGVESVLHWGQTEDLDDFSPPPRDVTLPPPYHSHSPQPPVGLDPRFSGRRGGAGRGDRRPSLKGKLPLLSGPPPYQTPPLPTGLPDRGRVPGAEVGEPEIKPREAWESQGGVRLGETTEVRDNLVSGSVGL